MSRALRAVATSAAAVLSLLAWGIPTPPTMIVAGLLGIAAALGPQWLRVVLIPLAAGLTLLTVPFQSLAGMALLLALAVVLIGLVAVDLAHASRSIRALAGAAVVTVVLVILWELTHLG